MSSETVTAFSSMLVLIGIVATACDPLRTISISRQVERLPDQACVVRVLESSKLVHSVLRYDDGRIVAALVLPLTIVPPRATVGGGAVAFEVVESGTSDNRMAHTFRIVHVGTKGSEQYQRYVEEAFSRLQDATVEACRS